MHYSRANFLNIYFQFSTLDIQCNGFLGGTFSLQLQIFIINYENLCHQTEYISFLMLFFFQIRTHSIYLQNDLRKNVSRTLNDVFSRKKRY